MPQVVGKEHESHHVEQGVNRIGESLRHTRVHRGGVLRREETRLDEERVHVDDQECRDHHPRDEHDARCRLADLVVPVHRVALRPRAPVQKPEQAREECVDEEQQEEDDLDRAEQRIGREELGVGVERPSSVLLEQEQVHRHVEQEVQAEEQAGQADEQFPADR